MLIADRGGGVNKKCPQRKITETDSIKVNLKQMETIYQCILKNN